MAASSMIIPNIASHFLSSIRRRASYARCIPNRGQLSTPMNGNKALERLIEWVQESGGYLHSSLSIVEDAPCGGGRGIVCTGAPLDMEQVQGTPMLLLPEDLVLSTEVARFGFSSHYEPQGAAPLSELDEATQLAIMLAHERHQGEDSFYHPYVSTLSDRAPCAWGLEPAGLELRLDGFAGRLGQDGVEAWRQEVLRNKAAMERHSEGAEERYKRFFPLTAEDFFWAMGQVLSRSFSSTSHLSLMPLIDLCNHQAGADHPELINVGGDENDSCFIVSSVNNGTKWQTLKTGEELFIRYFDPVSSGTTKQGLSVHSSSKVATERLHPSLSLSDPFLMSQPGATGTLLGAPEEAALLCFMSHGHVFPEMWSQGLTRP